MNWLNEKGDVKKVRAVLNTSSKTLAVYSEANKLVGVVRLPLFSRDYFEAALKQSGARRDDLFNPTKLINRAVEDALKSGERIVVIPLTTKEALKAGTYYLLRRSRFNGSTLLFPLSTPTLMYTYPSLLVNGQTSTSLWGAHFLADAQHSLHLISGKEGDGPIHAKIVGPAFSEWALLRSRR